MREHRHREVMIGRARAKLSVRLASVRGMDIAVGPPIRFTDGRAPEFRGAGRFRFGSNCAFRGGPTRGRLSTEPDGQIVLGERVGINFGCNFYSSISIEIGDNTLVGALVTIYDTNFHPVDESADTKSEPVKIGRHVWLGHGCTILPGVTIGDHAVIGSGSVVSRDVPARTLMAGNPAKPVRELLAEPDWSRW